MNPQDSPLPAPNALLLVALLSACIATIACGPKAAPGTTDAATASTSTADPNTTTSGSTGTTGDPSTPTTTSTPNTSSTSCSTSDCNGSSSGACSFVNCPDAPNGDDCDVFAQDCPEGQKCAAWNEDGDNSWNAAHCVEVTGDGQPGDPCVYDGIAVGSDDCAKGSMCWDTDENNVGTCVQQCSGSAEAPSCPKGPCTVSSEGVLNLCLTPCDPLLQDCPSTDLCVPFNNDFVCVLDDGGEEGQANDPCEFTNVCDPGLVCLDPATGGAGCDPAAGGCCTPFCKFPEGACPNPDQVCNQWYDPMQLPADDPQFDIGVCAVPQ